MFPESWARIAMRDNDEERAGGHVIDQACTQCAKAYGLRNIDDAQTDALKRTFNIDSKGGEIITQSAAAETVTISKFNFKNQ